MIMHVSGWWVLVWWGCMIGAFALGTLFNARISGDRRSHD